MGRGRLLVARRARLKQCTSTKSPIKKRDRPIYHVPRRVVWRLGGPSSKTETWIRTSGATHSNARLKSLAGAHRRAQIQRLLHGRKRRRPTLADHGAYDERQEDPAAEGRKISWSPGARLCNALLYSCFRSRRTIFPTDLAMVENGADRMSPTTGRTSSAGRTQLTIHSKYLGLLEPGFRTRYFVLASDHAAA